MPIFQGFPSGLLPIILMLPPAFTRAVWMPGSLASWLAVCVAWILLPLAGADEDAPHHQKLARIVGAAMLIVGLLARVLLADMLPVWWLVGTATAAVAGAGLVLGVLELPRKD